MPTLLKMRVPPPTDWSEFEDITRSALKVKWRSSDMQRNGRRSIPRPNVCERSAQFQLFADPRWFDNEASHELGAFQSR